MAINAHDSDDVPRFLLVDSSGRLVLGPSTQEIGKVEISDGTEQATINTNSFLEVANEHSLKGKTILFHSDGATDTTTTLHTVTAGKTYYLIAAGMTCKVTTADGIANMYIGLTTNHIFRIYSGYTATYNTQSAEQRELAFPHPIPVAAGVAIKISSNNAAFAALGWIIGWEE